MYSRFQISKILRLVVITIFFSMLVGRVAANEKPLTGSLNTMDPRAVSLGGTLRASPSGTSGIYLNPAVIAMTSIYHIGAMYQYTGGEEMHSGGAEVVDSVTTIVAAGLSFNYSRINLERMDHEVYDARIALAGNAGDVFYFGATGRYLHLKQNLASNKWGPGGRPALPSSGSRQVDGFTFDVGTALKLGQLVTLGLVGYNLTNTESVYAPIELGTGLSVHLLKMLLLEGNVVIDFTSHSDVNTELKFGTELFIAGSFGIRAGYDYDIYYDLHSITAGLGYVHPKFSIDFGFMREVVEDGRMIIAFGVKYFIN
jgi:hypothetical protein